MQEMPPSCNMAQAANLRRKTHARNKKVIERIPLIPHSLVFRFLTMFFVCKFMFPFFLFFVFDFIIFLFFVLRFFSSFFCDFFCYVSKSLYYGTILIDYSYAYLGYDVCDLRHLITRRCRVFQCIVLLSTTTYQLILLQLLY